MKVKQLKTADLDQEIRASETTKYLVMDASTQPSLVFFWLLPKLRKECTFQIRIWWSRFCKALIFDVISSNEMLMADSSERIS